MNKSLITLGLTVYNAIDTIERAVYSAVEQSWDNVEIIAVDDCSSDGSFELLVELEKIIPALKVIQNSVNSGVAVSRNQIIKNAQGEFIAFFDDDDVSLPNRVEEQFNRITEYERTFANEDPVISHTSREVVYPNGEVRIEETMGLNVQTFAPNGVSVAKRILFGEHLKDGYGSCATCSQMARTSVYRQLNGFDENLRRGEDTEFNIRLSREGGHFVGVKAPLVRQYMTKTSEKNLSDEYKFMRFILDKHKDMASSERAYQFAAEWLGLKNKLLEKRISKFVLGFGTMVLKHPFLTIKRAVLSLPAFGINLAFSRFHGKK
ncbi:glycosyltransferase family 2 protein [Vibrio europaeus]|uniref:glycosyltransferase family 2 protein n=1 Tax=Vibrio europaeus TaxID=300876 RepID=UPI0023408231|nr:glycosyltransferase family 2 protein [Vibrio europaeus]MDC5850452.1 glycosyltransferase family 2 protein [Vibrio europaeus]